MFRTLLVAVKPAAAQEFVIDFASLLAEQHHLAMDACAIVDLARIAPHESVPIGGGTFKAQRDEQFIAAARQHATDLMSRTEAVARARRVECHASVLEGDAAAIVAREVQRCDLLVGGHTRGGDASERSLVHSILKHSPRPAILVPQANYTAGRGVLVAYDGSTQAARALASFAQSGLADGRDVHIASFDDGTGAAREHAETAKSYLHRHGIACEVRIGALIKDAGSQILDEAQRISAGLLVMGAFGQRAVREFLLGSVTRTILDVLPVPVFLDH